MADLTGKTGDALSEELVKEQTEQAEQTQLEPKQEIVPSLLVEDQKEILTNNNVMMSTVSAPVPSGLSSAMYDQTVPQQQAANTYHCLLYTSPSPRDGLLSRMPSSA